MAQKRAPAQDAGLFRTLEKCLISEGDALMAAQAPVVTLGAAMVAAVMVLVLADVAMDEVAGRCAAVSTSQDNASNGTSSLTLLNAPRLDNRRKYRATAPDVRPGGNTWRYLDGQNERTFAIRSDGPARFRRPSSARALLLRPSPNSLGRVRGSDYGERHRDLMASGSRE